MLADKPESLTEAPSDRCIVTLVIDAAETLRAQLLSRISEACDQIEAVGERGLLLLRLCGARGRPAETQWPGGVTAHEVGKWEQALRRVERLNALTVAVAEGRCHGAAMEALVVADCRYAIAGATLQLRTGEGVLWPGMILHRLASQLGIAGARRLLVRGEIEAACATGTGLIDGVVPDVQTALAAVDVSAHRDFGMHRRLLLDGVGVSYDEMLGCHLAACDRQLRRARANP